MRLGPGAARGRAGRGPRQGRHARRRRSSSRCRRTSCPNPLPTVTPKQKAGARQAPQGGPAGRAAAARPAGEVRHRRRSRGLVEKGLVRKFTRARRDGCRASRRTRTARTTPPLAGHRRSTPTRSASGSRSGTARREPAGITPFLLHGVTGSGKTEIYLRAIEEVVQQGKEAIVLVPEICLTPQTIERFRGRCGDVAVLHSHLTDAERGGYWRRVAAGQVQVVVGARSAVFAPTRKLGLIVIDEEHENSFKQESTPRYHARDVAVMRARLEEHPDPAGLGDAGAGKLAQRRDGAATRSCSLPNRVENRPLPQVRARSTCGTSRSRPASTARSARRSNAAMRRGAQGRRAGDPAAQPPRVLARTSTARRAATSPPCQHCDLALTFHRTQGGAGVPLLRLRDGRRSRSARSAASRRSATRGSGTEKLQAEIEEKFPGPRRASGWTRTR